MKRKILAFLVAASAGLLLVPLINVYRDHSSINNLRSRAFLFNIDFISESIALMLYPLGISVDPQQVIIGHDDWLFLGDKYVNTLTTDRKTPSLEDYEKGRKIADNMEQWRLYLAGQGVKSMKIIVGPNKGSIYPEKMPQWARSVAPNAMDTLFSGPGASNYVDVRAALLAEKEKSAWPLYYKTDTHWNFLGARVAFQEFSRQMGQEVPDIKWPSDDSYKVDKVESHSGGDLANFLRISRYMKDVVLNADASRIPVKITEINFDTKEVVSVGADHHASASATPMLIKTEGALNQRKVLWLSDSFGGSMSSMMTATFSDIMKMHWQAAMQPQGRWQQLVQEWQPDYVLITVVERSARDAEFSLPPRNLPGPGLAGDGR